MERLGTSKASDRSPAIALSRILEELLKWAKPVKLRQWSYNKYSFARTIMMLQMLANSTCCLFHRNPSKPPSPFQVSNGISTSVGGKGSSEHHLDRQITPNFHDVSLRRSCSGRDNRVQSDPFQKFVASTSHAKPLYRVVPGKPHTSRRQTFNPR
ncbi:hypothetical protein BDR05DRAFT_969369 [Suillus weaverae]|nr:hypothetical protein BDR05DRAFT_969369 [Suillus weaverae]